MSNYLVLGAGVAGMSAAAEFAKANHTVTILEQSSGPGGSLLSYCCKATDSCVRCGVCTGHTLLRESLETPGVALQTGITVVSGANSGKKVSLQVERKNPYIDLAACVSCGLCADVCPEKCITRYSRGGLTFYKVDYAACRLHKGEACSLCAEACPARAIVADRPVTRETFTGDGMVIAAGHEPFNAEKKPRYGYKRLPNVMTGLEAEEKLQTSSFLIKEGEKVAFIQCVGSRDPEIGRNYCSAVCCSYALRMANTLAHRSPGADITVYYIDIQNFDKALPCLLSDIQARGVVLKRGLPFKAEASANGGITLTLLQENGGSTVEDYDAVVLSVGLAPSGGVKDFASMIGLQRDEFGFILGVDENVVTAGTCREPQSIPDAMNQAKTAAMALMKKNGGSSHG